MRFDRLAGGVAALIALGTGPAALAAETAATGRPAAVAPADLKALGEPIICLPPGGSVTMTPVGRDVLMARRGGNQWFRNDLAAACPAMNPSRILQFRSTSTQRCQGDQFTIVDQTSRATLGTCNLGRFTPVEVPRGTRFAG